MAQSKTACYIFDQSFLHSFNGKYCSSTAPLVLLKREKSDSVVEGGYGIRRLLSQKCQKCGSWCVADNRGITIKFLYGRHRRSKV